MTATAGCRATTSAAPVDFYSFSSASYNAIDELGSYSSLDPASAGDSTHNISSSTTLGYSSDGTRRLISSTGGPNNTTYAWGYDVFGNRLRQTCSSTYAGICSDLDTNYYGSDNKLTYFRNTGGTTTASTAYYSDNEGNRILQVDSSNGAWVGPSAIMSYTAKGQLFFSMTKTAQAGTYDMNWHWYDGNGMRVVTHNYQASGWSTGTAPTTGNRTYYIYDGSDVSTMIVHNGTWWVQARFVTGGVDQPLAGWFQTTAGSGAENLSLINDYQGSTRAAMKPDGTREDYATGVNRNAFGTQEAASGTGGSYNVQAGFGGASTPNSTGGFTYLRNRWYDPTTGRFLTQDPIGLAGGVNLYAYAGGNPVAFNDPFGLCPDPNDPNCPKETPVTRLAGQLHDVANAILDRVVSAFESIWKVESQVPVVGPATQAATGVGSDGQQLGAGDRALAAGTAVLDAAGGASEDAAAAAWHAGTFGSSAESAAYHYAKHGTGQGLVEYTREALQFLEANHGSAVQHALKTGETGIKITTETHFGIFTDAGKIVSYGPR